MPKYEEIPTPNEASYVLVSMHDFPGIHGYLSVFPEELSDDELSNLNSMRWFARPKGVSATLLWSGREGYNTPLTLFSDMLSGIVLDPKYLVVPHAEFLAHGTESVIPNFVSKFEYVQANNQQYQKYADTIDRQIMTQTKYPSKQGRSGCVGGTPFFTTNIACNEHLPGAHQQRYNAQGTFQVYANNVWRKFFKKGENQFNEGIVYKARLSPISPIIGLLIAARNHPITLRYHHERTDPLLNADFIRNYLEILQRNPNLSLFLYNAAVSEFMIRYIPNAKAQLILKSTGSKSVKFSQLFDQAIPSVSSPSLLEYYYKKSILSNYHANLEAQKKKLGPFWWIVNFYSYHFCRELPSSSPTSSSSSSFYWNM